MPSFFKDKEKKVIAVDSSGPVRSLLTEVLRSCGFADCQALSNVKDAVHLMEAEDIAWVIVPLCLDQPVNALHLLRICSEIQDLHNTRVSIFIEENEQPNIKTCFELGMYSWFEKPFNKELLTQQIQEQLATLEKNQWNETLTSADFLKKVLIKEELFEQAIQLSNELLNLYPNESRLFLDLAEAQHKLGQSDAAQSSFRQVKMLEPSLAEEVDVKMKELFGENMPEEDSTLPNILDLKNVVIVDSDDASQQVVKKSLSELGVPEDAIHTFAEGEEAWEHLQKSEEPGLVFQEWKIPKISGPMLLQRFRMQGFHESGVIVFSSLLNEQDIPLVKEMGVDNVVKKPTPVEKMTKEIVWTIKQNRQPNQAVTIERKLRQLIAKKDSVEARKLFADYQQMPKVPQTKICSINAEIAYLDENYELAREEGVKALKSSKDSIHLLNLLGKVFMKLQDFGASLSCFQKAQTISPLNVERLCKIAEVNNELDNKEETDSAMNDARELDSDNSRVSETEAQISISNGDHETAKQILANMDSLDSIIAYMNNKAVALARSGSIEDGIELYKKTLKSVPDDNDKIRSKVAYNLSIAYIRASEYVEAIEILKVVKEGTSLFQKTRSLKSRLEYSLKSGKDFVLRDSNPSNANEKGPSESKGQKDKSEERTDKAQTIAEIKPTDENLTTVASITTEPGAVCCFLIYENPNKDNEFSKYLENRPRFRRRSAIERNEAMGVEAEMKRKSS